jgi:hypothetical protein
MLLAEPLANHNGGSAAFLRGVGEAMTESVFMVAIVAFALGWFARFLQDKTVIRNLRQEIARKKTDLAILRGLVK